VSRASRRRSHDREGFEGMTLSYPVSPDHTITVPREPRAPAQLAWVLVS